MMNSLKTEYAPRLTLDVETARELMTPNPVSIREYATVKEAVALLIDKGISAAPVIDRAGRPTGVLSRSDLLVHDREQIHYLKPVSEYFDQAELVAPSGEKLPRGFQVEEVDRTRVKELMTPVVFSVRPETPVPKVVEEMVSLKVHRLFVVDKGGVLVGVISAVDVLRHLHPDLA